MKITIVCGGSGSEKIQEGLFAISSEINVNLIINGYDDGKSTGILRNQFSNTLGISDFRKNQILEFKFIYGDNEIYKLLNHRFTIKNPNNYVIEIINNTNFYKNIQLKIFLINNINYFFKTEQTNIILYDDSKCRNIIYCSLLDKNNNNMEIVCNIIKNELKLKNNIYLNSNDNLILKGVTKNNKLLLDESSIVDFNDTTDKIVDIYFNKNTPLLNKNTEELLLDSDIIIFSCGTQFSSLIPTYKTLLFNETIKKSKASKFLILNCDYDKDIINYSGNELLDKINQYLSLDNIKIIISDEMNKNLFPTDDKYNYINIPLLIKNKYHDGYLLWKYIFKYNFNFYYNKNYIFDYEYTIFDKNFIEISNKNINLLKKIKNKIIITNNCYSNLLPIDNITIYSNIGNVINNNEIVNNLYILENLDIYEIYQIIYKIDPNNDFIIQNRNNISIAIKPVRNRDELMIKIKRYLLNTNYEIIQTGKTTIEFIIKGLSKRNIFVTKKFLNETYTYISDENDINLNILDKIKFLNVKNIISTNLFLNSIIMNEKYDFCIIVGGINKRMNINYPKCLIKVDNETILMNIINKILPYSNNIFICGNEYYKKEFLEFEQKITNNKNIKMLYFNSIDGSHLYPKGNGENIYQLLNTMYLTNKIFIMWGDIIIKNNKIIEEMYNYNDKYDILIPTIYEKNPYAYLIIDENNNVKNIEYRKNIVELFGYHDQCIFLCDKNKIKDKINLLINQNTDNEINFLDIIKYMDKVSYYKTKYSIKSFNTFKELNTN